MPVDGPGWVGDRVKELTDRARDRGRGERFGATEDGFYPTGPQVRPHSRRGSGLL